ncbi:MAG: hypothetical protein ACI4ET_12985, partial [Bilifractor sp.]
EIEANIFNAELRLSDQSVLEPIGYYRFKEIYDRMQNETTEYKAKDLLYFATQELWDSGDGFASIDEIACGLQISPYLVEYKYKALQMKGFILPAGPEVKSDYLKDTIDRHRQGVLMECL